MVSLLLLWFLTKNIQIGQLFQVVPLPQVSEMRIWKPESVHQGTTQVSSRVCWLEVPKSHSARHLSVGGKEPTGLWGVWTECGERGVPPPVPRAD